MADYSQQPDRDAGRPTFSDAQPDDVVSVKPLFQFLTAYRRVIGLAVAAAMVLCAAVLLLLMFVLPTERTASVQVRLLFDGAADFKYPNGTPFSPAEVIATPVLNEVYRANDLQRFGTYEAFKESMAILQASLEQELLAAAYSARLADSKLTPTDRARLEDEFRRKREAIKDPVYALTIRRTERLKLMPSEVMEKVLNDTLATWAQQAKDVKGAMRFDVPVISREILKPNALDGDFLLAVDNLRVQARRAMEVTQKLLLVPGAATLRGQKDRISLADISYALADTLRTEVEPMAYLIQRAGLTNDPQAMAQYLHGHVVELRLDRDATQARIRTLQEALQVYMSAKGAPSRDASAGPGPSGRQPGADAQTLIPQVSDTFLDKIIEMSTQSKDVEYRQDLTDRLIKEGITLSELDRARSYYEQLEGTMRVGVGAVPPAQVQALRARLKDAFDSIQLSIGRLVTLYEELSEQRLNPAGTLYAVSRPFAINTQHALTWSTVVLAMALAALLGLIAAPLGCAYHRARARTAGTAIG